MTTFAIDNIPRPAAEERTRRIFPITVDTYHMLAENGAFKPTDRVELIGGELFVMSPIGKLHARCVAFLNRFLSKIGESDHIVLIQSPITLIDESEPQPDIAVVRYRSDFYLDRLPSENDVELVIEVADTSVDFDRNVKLRKYASAGIPEAWLVDLTSERVEVHTQPKASGYGLVKIFARGENAVSEEIPAIDLSVNELFG